MKQALLLHGTDDNAQSNWLPWLQHELEIAGWRVWTPNLPRSHEPNTTRYNDFIFANSEWSFTDQTIIVGHSSGAMATLGILQQLPKEIVIDQAILIGSFKNDLGWPNLSGLFEEPFDFEVIKQHARKFLFIHSDDDPYCPLEHAQYLAGKLNGELMIIPGQKHFSAATDQKYTQFPLLKQIILE
jgi:predicted alpha/beta hydrolase family esterase